MSLSTSVQITLSTSVDSSAPAKEYFSPEIQLVDKSSDGKIVSTPPLYLPKFPDVQSDEYEEGKTYSLEGCDLLRRGLQVVRVYGSGNFQLKSLQRGTADVLQPYTLSDAKTTSVEITATIFNKTFKKSFTYPEANEVFNGSQIQYQGKRTALVTELLQFDGVNSRKIRYWYDNPVVSVKQATTFINKKGKEISAPVNRSDLINSDDSTTDEVACPFLYGDVTSSTIGFKGEYSTFYAKEECWGTLEITYQVTFHEYFVLYDYGNIAFKFKVTKPQLERWGKAVKEIPTSGSTDAVYTPGHLKWQEEAQLLGSELTTNPISYLYKIKAIEVEQPETLAISLFLSNGKRQAVAQISSGAQYVAIPQRSLPSMVIYEERQKQKIYPNGAGAGSDYLETEGTTRLHYLNAYGEIVEHEIGALDDIQVNETTN